MQNLVPLGKILHRTLILVDDRLKSIDSLITILQQKETHRFIHKLIIEKVEFNRKEVNPFGLFWLNFSSILKFMRKTVIPVTVIFLIGISLPYIVGWLSSNNEVFFTGFIANPLDSFSYLAKMRQGYDGLWLFSLPFSSQTSTPVFLFEYYLFLGHVARWLGLSLIFVFHATRIINSLPDVIGCMDFSRSIC